MEITYIDKKRELRWRISSLEKYLRDLNLRDLSLKLEELREVDKIVKMFKKDVNYIEMQYQQNKISKHESEEYLRDLSESAKKLEEDFREINERLRVLLRMLKDIAEVITEVPHVGIPIDEVVEGIIRIIRGIELPKKEFGVLKNGNLKNISDFISEYKTGVMVADVNLKEDIEKVLSKKHISFESKELGKKRIFLLR